MLGRVDATGAFVLNAFEGTISDDTVPVAQMGIFYDNMRQ